MVVIDYNIILRFLIVFILSFIFGLERQSAHKPTGFGTFIFVALGSCTLGIVATQFSDNPISIIAATVTGIGFLGAGALIRSPDKVFGFTTAASIWVFSIFGLMIGIQKYFLGITTYIVIWLVIISDRYLEGKGIGGYRKKITITTNKIVDDKKIIKHLAKYSTSFRMINVEVNKGDNYMQLTYLIEAGGEDMSKMTKDIQKESWVKSTKIE